MENRKASKKFKLKNGQVWQNAHGWQMMVHSLTKGWVKCISENGKLVQAIISHDEHGNEYISGYTYSYDAVTVPRWAQ